MTVNDISQAHFMANILHQIQYALFLWMVTITWWKWHEKAFRYAYNTVFADTNTLYLSFGNPRKYSKRKRHTPMWLFAKQDAYKRNGLMSTRNNTEKCVAQVQLAKGLPFNSHYQAGSLESALERAKKKWKAVLHDHLCVAHAPRALLYTKFSTTTDKCIVCLRTGTTWHCHSMPPAVQSDLWAMHQSLYRAKYCSNHEQITCNCLNACL